MNKLRHMLAVAIERNGGYATRGDRFALEWTVGLYYANLDRDHIYKVMCEHHGYLPPPTGLEWDENLQWQWAQEDTVSGLDADTYRSYGPETAKRYGLPHDVSPLRYKRRTNEMAYYPAKKEGWILDGPFEPEYFDVKFGLYGRGGKHLCVEEFEGHRLNVRSEDLADQIRNDHDGSFPNRWCVRLLAMIEEWDKCFSSKIASDEMEYQAAFRMHQELGERADAWRKRLKEAREMHHLGKLALVIGAPLMPSNIIVGSHLQ